MKLRKAYLEITEHEYAILFCFTIPESQLAPERVNGIKIWTGGKCAIFDKLITYALDWHVILLKLPKLCHHFFLNRIKQQTSNSIFHFIGACEHGTFPCGPIEDHRCVPQHLICSRSDACREDYRALCGLNYGSTDFIESIVNSSTDDINFCCKLFLQLQRRETVPDAAYLISYLQRYLGSPMTVFVCLERDCCVADWI